MIPSMTSEGITAIADAGASQLLLILGRGFGKDGVTGEEGGSEGQRRSGAAMAGRCDGEWQTLPDEDGQMSLGWDRP